MKKRNLAFVALGCAFLAIGIAQKNAFFVLGLVFLVLGFMQRKAE